MEKGGTVLDDFLGDGNGAWYFESKIKTRWELNIKEMVLKESRPREPSDLSEGSPEMSMQ